MTSCMTILRHYTPSLDAMILEGVRCTVTAILGVCTYEICHLILTLLHVGVGS